VTRLQGILCTLQGVVEELPKVLLDSRHLDNCPGSHPTEKDKRKQQKLMETLTYKGTKKMF